MQLLTLGRQFLYIDSPASISISYQYPDFLLKNDLSPIVGSLEGGVNHIILPFDLLKLKGSHILALRYDPGLQVKNNFCQIDFLCKDYTSQGE